MADVNEPDDDEAQAVDAIDESAFDESAYDEAAFDDAGLDDAGVVPGDDALDGALDSEPLAELPPVEETGDYRVDVALSRLEELPGVPTAQHVDIYDDIHQQLQGALADLDGG